VELNKARARLGAITIVMRIPAAAAFAM